MLPQRHGIILAGESKSGKTSLANQIQRNDKNNNTQDRNSQQSRFPWSSTARMALYIYEETDFRDYSMINPFAASSNSTVLIHHNICKDIEHSRTLAFLINCLQQNRKNIHIVLTHIDQLNDAEVKQRTETFQEAISTFFDSQIQLHTKHKANFKARKSFEIIETENEIEKYFSIKKSMRYFAVSSKTGQGIDELKAYLETKVVELEETDAHALHAQNQTWVRFWNELQKKEGLHIALHQVQSLYHVICENSSSEKEYVRKFLKYLNDNNYILWKENDPELENVVFHRPDVLQRTLNTLLPDKVSNMLKHYQNQNEIPTRFPEKSSFDKMCDLYHKEALLTPELLTHIWSKFNFQEEEINATLTLMTHMGICYEIKTYTGLRFYYFEWFASFRKKPSYIDLDHISKLSNESVSFRLDCEFKHSITSSIYQTLFRALHQYAIRGHYYGERQVWSEGLMVTLNRIECIIFRSQESKTLSCLVTSPIEDIVKAWDCLAHLEDTLKKSMRNFPNDVQSVHTVCVHCVLKGVHSPQKWNTEDLWVLRNKGSCETYVRCAASTGEYIPSALLIPVSGTFLFSCL